jgi:asparagine synthase (glutamine-hydrolysing)
VKPLYYTEHAGKFIFSSEIKAILESDIPRTLDSTAFSHYMRLLYTPGEDTLFKGIKRLLPGHTLLFKNGHMQISSYYKLPQASLSSKIPLSEIHQEIRNALDVSVERQLVADVPVGVYLSGGIDSTLLGLIWKQGKKLESLMQILKWPR